MSNTPPTIYILDANVLVRLADADHPQHASAQSAIKTLRANGAVLRTVPQSLFEFWVVATRAIPQNGLGLTVSEAEIVVDYFVHTYWPMPDDPATLTYWRRLVVRYGVVGKQAHDARYVAAMQAHGLTHILSFDADFNRYAAEGITVTNPASVPAPAAKQSN